LIDFFLFLTGTLSNKFASFAIKRSSKIPPRLKRVALHILREILMSAFDNIHKVAKYLRCGGIFNDHFVATLLPVKEIRKSVHI